MFKPKKESTLKTDAQKQAAEKTSSRKLFLHLSLKNQILFIKQLAILIRAGVPLFQSLRMLKDQSRSRSMNIIMNQVIKDVENGQYLATTLGKFKKIFGELTINVIAVGEISGNLSDNLDHLVVSLKKKHALRRKVVSASVYPIFITIATLAITIMLTVFVFPKILPVFKSINYELPWTTRSLIFINNSVEHYGLFILLGIIMFVVGVWLLLRLKKVHFWFDKMLLSIPFVNRLV